MKSEQPGKQYLAPFILHSAFSICAFGPLLLCAFLFVSCSDKPPVSEKNFVEVYVHLQLFETQYASQPLVQKAKADSLLKAFNLNDSLVNSMLSWYSRKPERWDEFFTRVQKRMNEIKPAYLRKKK